jgi:hypothetical protein
MEYDISNNFQAMIFKISEEIKEFELIFLNVMIVSVQKFNISILPIKLDIFLEFL